MGTKDSLQQSDRVLKGLMILFTVCLIAVVAYGTYRIHQMDKELEKQKQDIEIQNDRLERQGSLLDQREKELNEMKSQNKAFELQLDTERNQSKKQLESKEQEIKKKQQEIDRLKEETERQKEELSLKKQRERDVEVLQASADNTKVQTEVLSAAAEPVEKKGRTMQMRATAYTAYCSGCSGITATGIDLRSNPNQKVIAVDPNVIPLGSKVYVEGYGTAIAGDTGGAIKGNKIDVFIPTKAEAFKFGVKQVNVTMISEK